MDRWEKILHLLLTGAAVIMAVYLTGRGYEILSQDHFERGKEILAKAYQEAGSFAADYFLPGYDYEEARVAKNWTGSVLMALENQIPFIGREGDAGAAASLGGTGENLEEKADAENRQKAAQEENEKARGEKSNAGQESGETDETKEASSDSGVQENDVQENVTDQSGDGKENQAVQTFTPGAVTKQVEIPLDQLQDFSYLLNHFFVVDSNTTALESEIDIDQLMGKDMTLPTDAEGPQILIYHTHSQEGFADSVDGDRSTSVVGIGDYLVQILEEQYGYQVLHITDTFDIIDGTLDRSRAYDYAEPVITEALANYPTIQVVIDLHRDGVDESKHLVTEVNGKPTAQIMFFNGLCRTNRNGSIDYLPNPYIEDNLAFSFQLEYLAKEYYPDFTRCIYLKGYRYNLHVRPRSLLLEVGAQTNTVEEAKNAMEPFADILNKVLRGQTS